MDFASWHVQLDRAVIGTAIHNGHDLRSDVDSILILDEGTRLREEDAHTGLLAAFVGSYVVVNRSRFEVDLNRPEEESVYGGPEDAWGLDVWGRLPDDAIRDGSKALHRSFYHQLGKTLEQLVARHGGFVLYDIHSYNHRRQGPQARPDDPADNPAVNLGTGTLPARWRPVADSFLTSMRSVTVGGEPLDARENVKFEGRELARFVHDNFGEVGCALAIEFRKEYVDEWTDRVDEIRLGELGVALAKSVDPVLRAKAAA
jgi:N-formylglutamate deformylase